MSDIIFRKTQYDDIPQVLEIISQAQRYMKENNIDQWQNGYPNEESIISDIKKGEAFVGVLKDTGKIAATLAISLRGEPTYGYIDGKWKYDEPYAVVHRVAVSSTLKGSGIAGKAFSFAENYAAENGFNFMRIDTHCDNKSMQRCIEKFGFEYSGIIYLADSSKRMAFEYAVNKR